MHMPRSYRHCRPYPPKSFPFRPPMDHNTCQRPPTNPYAHLVRDGEGSDTLTYTPNQYAAQVAHGVVDNVQRKQQSRYRLVCPDNHRLKFIPAGHHAGGVRRAYFAHVHVDAAKCAYTRLTHQKYPRGETDTHRAAKEAVGTSIKAYDLVCAHPRGCGTCVHTYVVDPQWKYVTEYRVRSDCGDYYLLDGVFLANETIALAVEVQCTHAVDGAKRAFLAHEAVYPWIEVYAQDVVQAAAQGAHVRVRDSNYGHYPVRVCDVCRASDKARMRAQQRAEAAAAARRQEEAEAREAAEAAATARRQEEAKARKAAEAAASARRQEEAEARRQEEAKAHAAWTAAHRQQMAQKRAQWRAEEGTARAEASARWHKYAAQARAEAKRPDGDLVTWRRYAIQAYEARRRAEPETFAVHTPALRVTCTAHVDTFVPPGGGRIACLAGACTYGGRIDRCTWDPVPVDNHDVAVASLDRLLRDALTQ